MEVRYYCILLYCGQELTMGNFTLNKIALFSLKQAKLYDTALLCWAVAIGIYAGNTMYQINCFAGGVSAVFIMPGGVMVLMDVNKSCMESILYSCQCTFVLGVDDTTAVRVCTCAGYAVVVLGLLFWGKTRYLSIGLGVVLIGMVILFLVVVIELGLDWSR